MGADTTTHRRSTSTTFELNLAALHHIIEWQHGGPTAIDNLVMLCRFHHRLIHGSDWAITMARGAPEFTPPKWIDVSQTPRRKPPPQSQIKV